MKERMGENKQRVNLQMYYSNLSVISNYINEMLLGKKT